MICHRVTSDWIIAEALLVEKLKSGKAKTLKGGGFAARAPSSQLRAPGSTPISHRLSAIKLVITDVDGVLTDAGMYYAENGDELKKFNTRDAVGLRLLREAGLKVGIITSEDTQIVARRAQKMGVDFLIQGAKNKAEELDEILAETGLTAEQVAFIGDDINDLTILSKVGLAATPADGQPAVKAKADYICKARGGEGAVREIAESLLAKRAMADG